MSFRLEVWDRKADRRRAIFGALYAAERRQVLQAEETLTAEVHAQDGAADALVSGAVLRLQREGVAGEFSLWRLSSREKRRGPDGSLGLQITADALWMDFRRGTVRQRLADGRFQYAFGLEGLTPAEWLASFILPGYEGDAVQFALGAVEVSEPVDLTFERTTTPLEALRMLEAASRAEAQFRLSPDGSTYFVDLLGRVGAVEGTAELRYAKNVRGISRMVDDADVETRLRAVGSGLLTLADAEWKVAGVSGSTAARVVSFDGPHPVFEGGAFVGLYLYRDGSAYPITASDAEAGTVTVDATGLPALSAGAVVYLATDPDGTRLDYLESPEGVQTYGVQTGVLDADDVPDAVNVVANPDLAEWSGGLPVQWERVGLPTVTEETDRFFVRHGERAARVQATESGEGLLSAPFTITHPAERQYTAMLAGLTLIEGQARLELRGPDGAVYPVAERPVIVERGVYTELKAGPVHDEPIPEGEYRLAILAHGDGAEFVADTAMVTAAIGNDVPAFVAGSGAHLLWERAAAELDERRRPRLEYQVDVVDLHRADPTHFRFDELRLGDSVKLRDPDFPAESVRIVELSTDLLRAEATQVALADSARQRVVDPFRPPPPPLGGRLPGPGQRPGSTGTPSVLHVMRQWDGTVHELTLGALGSPNVATLELRTKTSPADPWPSAPLATITGRQGWFGAPVPVPGESTVYYQVLPRDGRGVAGEPVEDSWSVAIDAERPTAAIELHSETATHETLRFTGALGQGGRLPLAYQYAVEGVTDWSQWAPMPDGEIVTDGQAGRPSPIARSERTRTVLLRVRDADGRESQVASYALSSEPPDLPEDLGRDIRVVPRWQAGPSAATLELLLDYGSEVRSIRVRYIDPTTLQEVSYTHDPPSADRNAVYAVLDGSLAVRLWPYGEAAPTITVTPYTQTGGGGTAGIARHVQPGIPDAPGVEVADEDQSTVLRGDRILVQSPQSLGLEVVTGPGGRPLIRVAGQADPSQGGTGLAGPLAPGQVLVGAEPGPGNTGRFLDASDIRSGTFGLARLPVASSGQSSASLLVRADDARLSDARPPTSHALTSHTGDLPFSRVVGGTGATNRLLIGGPNGVIDVLEAPTSAGQVIVSTGGAGRPEWGTVPGTLPPLVGEGRILMSGASGALWSPNTWPGNVPQGAILIGGASSSVTSMLGVAGRVLRADGSGRWTDHQLTASDVGALPITGGEVTGPTVLGSGIFAGAVRRRTGSQNVVIGYEGTGSTQYLGFDTAGGYLGAVDSVAGIGTSAWRIYTASGEARFGNIQSSGSVTIAGSLSVGGQVTAQSYRVV